MNIIHYLKFVGTLEKIITIVLWTARTRRDGVAVAAERRRRGRPGQAATGRPVLTVQLARTTGVVAVAARTAPSTTCLRLDVGWTTTAVGAVTAVVVVATSLLKKYSLC